MINYIWCGIILMCIIYSIFRGGINDISSSIFSSSKSAVEFILGLTGTFCFWSGIMNIIEKSGFDRIISKLLSPIIKLLFKSVDKDFELKNTVCLNITANILGLGNAATPLGIEAMKKFRKNEFFPDYATNDMVMFVMLNSTAIKIIPTTVAAIRQNNGAVNPMDILLPTLITCLISLITGIILVKIMGKSRYE